LFRRKLSNDVAFLSIKNIVIKGIAACVPPSCRQNPKVSGSVNMAKTTGVQRMHVATDSQCASDLCAQAAEELIAKLQWDKKDIGGLIVVTQTPDYILPANAPILQSRLGLPTDCFSLDISLGCSGYIYGLTTLAGYMQNGMIKKALLLAGDTISRTCSENDKSTYPLFGDAGSATAIEYVENEEGFKVHLGSDGSGYQAIAIPGGGFRSPYSGNALTPVLFESGISRNSLQLTLDGMDVFSFGIKRAPESVNALIEHFQISKPDVDYYFFHQANLMMNERIRKKLELPEEKVLNSLRDFGNTSSASIPLTMVTQAADPLRNGENRIVACGFGVGLSWGSLYFTAKNLVIPDLIIYE